MLNYIRADSVDLRNIVSVLRIRTEILKHLIIAFEIMVERVNNLFERVLLYIINKVPQRRERVDRVCDTLSQYLTVIVDRTAVFVIAPVFDAALNQD